MSTRRGDFAACALAVELILLHVRDRAADNRSTATTTSTGICSTAVLLAHAAREWAPVVDSYLPDRMADGYGLSALDRLAPGRRRRPAARDNRLRGSPPSRRWPPPRAQGMAVVVTDHHATAR